MRGPLVEIQTFRLNSGRNIPLNLIHLYADFYHSPKTASRIQLSEVIDNRPFATGPEVTGFITAEVNSKTAYPGTI